MTNLTFQLCVPCLIFLPHSIAEVPHQTDSEPLDVTSTTTEILRERVLIEEYFGPATMLLNSALAAQTNFANDTIGEDYELMEETNFPVGDDNQSGQIIQGIKRTIRFADSIASETVDRLQPVAEGAGSMIGAGINQAGVILIDTGLDTLEKIREIPWSDVAVVSLNSGSRVVSTVGATSSSALSRLVSTPLGRRIVGGVNTTITTARLRATQGLSSVLRSAFDEVGKAVNALNNQETRLYDKLNHRLNSQVPILNLSEPPTTILPHARTESFM